MSGNQRRVSAHAYKDIPIQVRYDPPSLVPTPDVFQGRTDQVIDWVGSSPVRAKRVLAFELAANRPRQRLLRAMRDLLQEAASREANSAQS